MRILGAAAVAAFALTASAASARTADYSVSEAQMMADAQTLDAGPQPALPAKAEFDVVAEDLSKLDQQLRLLAISCRAWKVDNPLSQMVGRVLGMLDRDGDLAPVERRPLVSFRADSALSTMRCVVVKEMVGRCLTRTTISGTATVERPGSAPRTEPVSIEVEHQQKAGVCSGLARGTALSGRSASIKLAERLRELASR